MALGILLIVRAIPGPLNSSTPMAASHIPAMHVTRALLPFLSFLLLLFLLLLLRLLLRTRYAPPLLLLRMLRVRCLLSLRLLLLHVLLWPQLPAHARRLLLLRVLRVLCRVKKRLVVTGTLRWQGNGGLVGAPPVHTIQSIYTSTPKVGLQQRCVGMCVCKCVCVCMFTCECTHVCCGWEWG